MNTWNSLLISLGQVTKRSASAGGVLEHRVDAMTYDANTQTQDAPPSKPRQPSPAAANGQRTRGSTKSVSDHEMRRIPWLSFR
jgi:hypothetical protein